MKLTAQDLRTLIREASMSYSRFENTAKSMGDCIAAVEEVSKDPIGAALGSREESFALDLEDLCHQYLASRARLRGE